MHRVKRQMRQMSSKHRRSIRLRGYDYTQAGAYFVTICTYGREHLFGEVIDGVMHVNEFGQIVQEEWFRTAQVRPYVQLQPDEFVVMPNHIHGIIWIVDDDATDVGAQRRSIVGAQRRPVVGAQRRCAPTTTGVPRVVPRSLGAIVRAIKSAITKRINILRDAPGSPVWQRNYWEHIIRTERALQTIRRYIIDNPRRWARDRYNAQSSGSDPAAREIWRMLQDENQHTNRKEEVRQ